MAGIDIEVLTPDSARLWFEARSASMPTTDEIGQLAGMLGSGPLQPHLRVVVKSDGRPFGRLAARVADGCIRIWNPDFCDGSGTEDLQKAMRLLLARVASLRGRAGLAHLAIENRPGDDLAHNDSWLRALAQAGYAETCAYRVYVLSLEREQKRGATMPPELAVCDVDRHRDDVLVALYRTVKLQTLEQRDVDCERPQVAIDRMKTIGRGRESAAWLLACRDGAPAGYALANLADETDFEGVSAWLVDIGCRPELRGMGIASALLAAILRRLRSAGVRRLLAAIDDVNLPSIRLHASLGFLALPNRHYVYRLGP